MIVAGDFNTNSRHSPLIDRLNQDGYRSCFGARRIRTHIINWLAGTLVSERKQPGAPFS